MSGHMLEINWILERVRFYKKNYEESEMVDGEEELAEERRRRSRLMGKAVEDNEAGLYRELMEDSRSCTKEKWRKRSSTNRWDF